MSSLSETDPVMLTETDPPLVSDGASLWTAPGLTSAGDRLWTDPRGCTADAVYPLGAAAQLQPTGGPQQTCTTRRQSKAGREAIERCPQALG